ncbi:MAG TPA: GNAT family N-acetyltransferase [Patescibacteria group bacterium]|nr:GNAT family N-acetyltransferase [Patescibacteria group bacterium]
MTDHDVAAVAALSGQLGYPVAADRMAARFQDLVRDADAAILVAEEAGRGLAGWIHVCGRRMLETDACAEIAGLVVDAIFRRQGVGRRLVEAAESWARERGYARLRVRSNVTRDVAHAFYPGLGFNKVKSQHVYERVVDAGIPARSARAKRE